MATNVTQRNEVLRELLRWHLEKGDSPPIVCSTASRLHGKRMSYVENSAHTESSNHILSMLGYPDALPPAGRCPDDLSDR